MGTSWADWKPKKVIHLKCHFSFSAQIISQSDSYLWQKVMTSSAVGLRRHSKALSKAKLAPNNGHGHCLVVCCQCDPLLLSESRWDHYIWEICSANHWKLHLQLALVNKKGPSLLHNNAWPHITQPTLQNWRNWTTKFCLILHIHLIASQSTTSSSSISTTFCRNNGSTTSRRQKMLSKSSSHPKAQIFMLQE